MQPPPPQWQQPYQGQPPPPYTQYPQYGPGPGFQPPMRPPPPPKKKVNKGCLIAIGIVAVLVLAAIVDNTLHPRPSDTNAVQSTDVVGVITPPPTAKPQPTATTAQRIQKIVQDNSTSAAKVETKYDSSGTAVTETLSETLDNAAYRLNIKINCYSIQKALWTSGIKNLVDVEINFLGPLIDKYGRPSTGPMGLCELKQATAAKFTWENLSQDSAWNAYDAAIFSFVIQG